MCGTGQTYAYVSLMTAALFHVIRGSDFDWDNDIGPAPAIGQQHEHAQVSLLRKICSAVRCRNGECYVVNRSPRCVCESTFKGDQCEYVDMDQMRYSFIGNLLIFEWVRPPRLKHYSFVYYEPLMPHPDLNKKPILMRESEDTVLLGNVKGGNTRYRICIEDDIIAERVMSTNSLDLLTNCIEITSSPDWHSLAGWCLAAILTSVAVMLMYHQRDKIEILYFSKPYIMTTKPRRQSSEELLNNHSRKSSGHTIVNMNIARLEANNTR